jgi:hypothetical protein
MLYIREEPGNELADFMVRGLSWNIDNRSDGEEIIHLCRIRKLSAIIWIKSYLDPV